MPSDKRKTPSKDGAEGTHRRGSKASSNRQPTTGPSFTLNSIPGKTTADKRRSLVAPHIDSYNFFLEDGLSEAVKDLPPQVMQLGEGGPLLKLWVEGVTVGYPGKKNEDSASSKLTPRECRERGLTYQGALLVDLCYQIGDGDTVRTQRRAGECPVMVGSRRCHLRGHGPAQLSRGREEAGEMGGYFVVRGIERVIRLLQVPKRNYAHAISRGTFKDRGQGYSEKGVMMRCARKDQSTLTVTLHYISTGGATLRFSVRKQEFLVPAVIILKALRDTSDREIHERVLQGQKENTFLAAHVEVLLRDGKRWGLHSRMESLAFLGSTFRTVMQAPATATDVELGKKVIDRFVLVHLRRHADKQECLLFMLRKLYAFVQGRCREDRPDALANHELLLPGHLFGMIVKERVEGWLEKVRQFIGRDARMNPAKAVLQVRDAKYMAKCFERFGSAVGQGMSTFLSTGNVTSTSGLDLMQVSGFTIVAERINFLRYLAHFRSVHRGQFFTTMKTTAVRKLLPESWGFLCPVHTPDGSPCGLLNHLATACSSPSSLESTLVRLGVAPAGTGAGDGAASLPYSFLPVLLDGRVVGGGSEETLVRASAELRRLKVVAAAAGGIAEGRIVGGDGQGGGAWVDPTLEVAWVPPMKGGAGPYPGLYLNSAGARMCRPVLHLKSGRTEWIGPMEQQFMEIACLADDVRPGLTSHRELDPTNMLSLVASLTPFSDYNQSPRNMYQCQMGKQTMGTPAHCLTPHRTDNKMYKVLFPQAAIVQTRRHGEFQLDDYPQGTNAVVAVISYTGFDMEDAMILNKSSFERGFGHASVLKTFAIDLRDVAGKGSGPAVVARLKFCNVAPGSGGGDAAATKLHEGLGWDGLPTVGSWVKPGDPLYCVVDQLTGKVTVGKHKESEQACVETVRALGAEGVDRSGLSRASITLRFPRNPVIGDKFSSRHGQKGVMSILWPTEDMPFTESGLSPDIIINPHAFPSRMTIGMLIESMAGKSGAMHGTYQDATPFAFHEQDRVIDHFGEQLRSAGYAYHGSEPLYSGVTGTVMHADIFIGLVYYQRLRHMVSDKSQVRATGPVNQLTRQPIKGRKNKGGVRLGEMERDALLSHGAAFLLHDRLMNCSDRHVAHVCATCGSLLSTSARRGAVATAGQSAAAAAARAREF
ncbi:unnamed protein product, partial [Scytosiphon promiscuus]